jgi:protoporphyrinogen oxidase
LKDKQTTILGAGLAGLSCSYHLGHESCILFERNSYAGGHIYSHHRDGFVWDEGPHISFTKHPYVRELFEQSVNGELLEYECKVSNWYRGNWIPHPAQSNLYAVPEPERTACLDDFLNTRKTTAEDKVPSSYAEWLQEAFGSAFARTFPAVYTRKYWTCDPRDLATDWVGQRVFYPDVDTVLQGYRGPADKPTHYITKVRYPSRGGYISFAKKLSAGANVHFNHDVVSIDLRERLITFRNGKQHHYQRLINTLPLPELIGLSTDVPAEVSEVAENLNCSSLLLVNVTANHAPRVPFHWLYVYDENKLSTRINQINLLSPNNVPSGKTGIQVEVYASRYRPLPADHAQIANTVVSELETMGLIEKAESVHTNFIPYANVIFDHKRRAAQDVILSWLEGFGMMREDDDLEPMTDWDKVNSAEIGDLALAGRFGQWKYYWTDDCVLRGLFLSERAKGVA